MNIAIRQAALGAAVATALMLGAGAERSAQLSVLPGSNSLAHEWAAGAQIASANLTTLARTFETTGAKALGFALDAAVEIAARLK